MAVRHEHNSYPPIRFMPGGRMIVGPLTEPQAIPIKKEPRRPHKLPSFAPIVAIVTLSALVAFCRVNQESQRTDFEIEETPITILEGNVILRPGLNIRTTTQIAHLEPNILETLISDEYIVVNPEVVQGPSATSASGQETWLRFLWKGRDAYINFGPQTNRFADSLGNTKEIEARRGKAGETRFLLSHDGRRLPPTSVNKKS